MFIQLHMINHDSFHSRSAHVNQWPGINMAEASKKPPKKRPAWGFPLWRYYFYTYFKCERSENLRAVTWSFFFESHQAGIWPHLLQAELELVLSITKAGVQSQVVILCNDDMISKHTLFLYMSSTVCIYVYSILKHIYT